MHEDDHFVKKAILLKILTGLLLFRPQVGNRQFWSVALQPHEELLEEIEANK